MRNELQEKRNKRSWERTVVKTMLRNEISPEEIAKVRNLDIDYVLEVQKTFKQ